jgi:hypothetical protein
MRGHFHAATVLILINTLRAHYIGAWLRRRVDLVVCEKEKKARSLQVA